MTEVAIDESRLGDISGRVALVTGGASGIGRALVHLLHARKAVVYFCDVNNAAGSETAKALIGVTYKYADVSDFKSLATFFAFAYGVEGHIDLVFANAGVIQSTSIWHDELSPEGELLEPPLLTLNVTLKGVIFTAKLAMSYFKRNPTPGGALVFTASSSSYNERPKLPLYSIAKHGVLALMRSLRSIAPSQGVNVGAVAPGGTATNMVGPELQKRMEAVGVAVQQPEFIALSLLTLASNPSLNGSCFALLSGRAFEVETPIRDTMLLWYGEYATEQALRAASVSFGKDNG